MAGSSGEALKRRIAGFGALAVLAVLVVYAFWPRDVMPEGAPGGTAAGMAASPDAHAPSPGTTPRIDVPSAGLTQNLPPVPPRGSPITARLEDINLSPQARLMAEKLVCVCGCNDILATCTCNETPGSRDMKKYLQTLMDEGKTPAEVESAMVARYGDKVLPK
jgi:cytochrome c-type biogenesis protein CcmH/NrfF